MITRHCLLSLAIFISAMLHAQQYKTEHTNMLWAGYYNTIRFNKNLCLVNDAQLRTRNWTGKWSQFLVRSGLSLNLNKRVAVTGGFAFFKNAQYIGKQLLLKNEWRPWQEVSFQGKFQKASFTQRLRTEQRFLQQVANNTLTKTFDYTFRLRYRFDWQILLRQNLQVMAGNEVLVNPACKNNVCFFDQNRTFAGANYSLQENTTLQFQYVKIFQWRSTTSVLEDQNVFRLNILQQINFNKRS